MNITEQGFRAYIDLFYSTLDATASQYLREDLRDKLLHLSLLPARIIGYVSTQYGVAIEYEPANNTSIEVCRGSARVEDLLVQAPPGLRSSGPIVRIAARDTVFYNPALSGAFPFRLDGKHASVSITGGTFEAGAWMRTIQYAEVFGDRLRDNWSPEKAVSRAKDEILAALVESNRAKEKHLSIYEYIDIFKKKTVLVLGDYDEQGLQRLQGICVALVQLGYEPVLIRDVPDHPHHDLPQKVIAIAAISRFVVVDDSSKSGHLLEIELCKQNNWVTVLLRGGGAGGSWMTAGASHQSKVIFENPYDPGSPQIGVAEAASWAEDKLRELKILFDNTYPWRHQS
jgi:hypothetical protein